MSGTRATPASLTRSLRVRFQNQHIDPRRIHVAGYSAGAIQTTYMWFARSGYVASVLTYSGGDVTIDVAPIQDPAHPPPALVSTARWEWIPTVTSPPEYVENAGHIARARKPHIRRLNRARAVSRDVDPTRIDVLILNRTRNDLVSDAGVARVPDIVAGRRSLHRGLSERRWLRHGFDRIELGGSDRHWSARAGSSLLRSSR